MPQENDAFSTTNKNTGDDTIPHSAPVGAITEMIGTGYIGTTDRGFSMTF